MHCKNKDLLFRKGELYHTQCTKEYYNTLWVIDSEYLILANQLQNHETTRS